MSRVRRPFLCERHAFVTVDLLKQVAQNTTRRGGSAMHGRTTQHPGYATNQRVRRRVEEIFGWVKAATGCSENI